MVTGASSGVGRAIAVALARQGVQLCIVGRDSARLAEAASTAQMHTPVKSFQADLTRRDALGQLLGHLQDVGRLDILVHAAGVMHQGPMECASIDDLDRQYATNVRAPYMLTQCLLPLLSVARGQVVFINSSVGNSAMRSEIGQYAATKHALRAIADSLREEVNPKGIRVLTVYLGRTATPMQEAIHRNERKNYQPDTLLQPEDVAATVVFAIGLPRTAEVTDIRMRPMLKPAKGSSTSTNSM